MNAVASIMWDARLARHYDETSAEMFDPAVLGPTVDVLAELASAGGRALEFAVGTGRVALPLAARGVQVAGIELSPAMADVLRAKPGADAIDVTIGDMTTTRVSGSFSLVYLVFNTIMNVTTQEEQITILQNAAAHLSSAGRFVVEVGVPSFLLFPAAEPGRVFDQWVQASAPFRYVWPSELDLMARLAGLRLEHRWSGWDKSPFTAASTSQVAVYRKP
jgi:SAM-dependent methyltransferase